MFRDFKEFMLRGDLLAIVVGFIMALATFTLVEALVRTLITPMIAAIIGEPSIEKGPPGARRPPRKDSVVSRMHECDLGGCETVSAVHGYRAARPCDLIRLIASEQPKRIPPAGFEPATHGLEGRRSVH